METLNRADMMKAVTEGVAMAFAGALSSHGRLDLPHELLCDAIRKGVADAVYRVATSASALPHAAFYSAIKEGAADGMKGLRKD